MAGGISGLIDPGDGVFINIGGKTGELITDPNTGELKFVVGSNQPVGGGAGGSTQAGAAGQPGAAIGTQTLVQLLQSAPSWALPAVIFIGVLILAASVFRSR